MALGNASVKERYLFERQIRKMITAGSTEAVLGTHESNIACFFVGGLRRQPVMKAQLLLSVFVAGLATVICGCGTKTTRHTTQAPERAHTESVGDQEDEPGTLYTVADYDPSADPSEDLIATVSQASKSGKRILLEIGGQW